MWKLWNHGSILSTLKLTLALAITLNSNHNPVALTLTHSMESQFHSIEPLIAIHVVTLLAFHARALGSTSLIVLQYMIYGSL